MNPDPNNLPREELEVRITALLLGELEAAEAASLRELIQKDPELAKLHREIGQTLELVREAVAQPAEPSAAAVLPRMTEGKREALLARLRGPSVETNEKGAGSVGSGGATAVSGRVVPVEFPGTDVRPGRGSGTWLALAACLIALLGAATLWLAQPRLSASRVLAMSDRTSSEAYSIRTYARPGLLAGTTTNGVAPNLAYVPGTPAAGGVDSFEFTVADREGVEPAPQDAKAQRSLAGGGAMVPPPPPVAVASDEFENRGAVQARKPVAMEPQLAQRYGLIPKNDRVRGEERLNEARNDLGFMAGGAAGAVAAGLGGAAASTGPGGGGGGFGGGGGVVGPGGGPAGPYAINLAKNPASVTAPPPPTALLSAVQANGRVTPAPQTSVPTVLSASDVDGQPLSYAVIPGGQSAGKPGTPPVASEPQATDRGSQQQFFGAETTQQLSRGRMVRQSLVELRDAPAAVAAVAETANQPASPAMPAPASAPAPAPALDPVSQMVLVVSEDVAPSARTEDEVGETLALGRSLNRSAPARPAIAETPEPGLYFDSAAKAAAPTFDVPRGEGDGAAELRAQVADRSAAPTQVADSAARGERELREKQIDALDFSRRGVESTGQLRVAGDAAKAKRDDSERETVKTETVIAFSLNNVESESPEEGLRRKIMADSPADANRPVLATPVMRLIESLDRAGRKEQVDKAAFAKAAGPGEPVAGAVEKAAAVEAPKLAKLAVPQGALADITAAAPVAVTPALQPQPEVAASENPFSTFSLNVSDVSFKLAGASLDQGQLPSPGSIRTEEFLNAFQYRDPDPAPGMPVAFAWERARYPYAHNREILRLAVKTAARGRETGRPLNLVLAVDNSGSMERADRVRILQEAMRTLAGQLQPMDQVSLVSFARTARLWLDGVPGNRAGELSAAVTGLTPEGGTNLEEALRVAYETALKHFVPNGVNRVVLLTDGAANLGDTQPDTLKRSVENYRQRGVALDCFGIGWEGFNDDLLESLSRHGDGRYGFVNAPEDAGEDFAGQLAGALQVAASDVKVQVEFNPRRVNSWRQIGYAKHQLTKEQFRDNKVDAAELGAAETGNALYVVENQARGEGPVATVRVRYKVPSTGAYAEHEWVVPYTGVGPGLEQSSPAMRLATTSAAFGEWLASSPFASDVTPENLLSQIAGVPAAFAPDPRPARLEAMIRQAQSLRGR